MAAHYSENGIHQGFRMEPDESATVSTTRDFIPDLTTKVSIIVENVPLSEMHDIR